MIMDFRSIRARNEVVANSSKRYTPAIEIPPFSFGASPTTGDESPRWSAPADTVLNEMVITGTPTGSGGPTVVFLLKESVFGLVFVADITLGQNDMRNYRSIENDYTKNKLVAAGENLYAGIWYGVGGHDNLAIMLYAERGRGI